MAKNKLNLLLPPTPDEDIFECGSTASQVTPESSSEQGDASSIEKISARLDECRIAPQKHAEVALCQKEKVFGELHHDDFESVAELGFGNGGVVKKVVHKSSGITMAMKVIHLEVKSEVKKQIMRELRVLYKCNHANIVGFYGAFYRGGEINICMEYMDGGSLNMVLKNVGKFPEGILRQIALPVLKGLSYLKDVHSIIHRDIKPSNILINSVGEIKLCDFGVSGELINSMASSFVGTRNYMAPERIEGGVYSIQSDIWSLGITIVELAIGVYPIPPPSSTKQEERSSENENVGADANFSKFMTVFELLNYIVFEPPPKLPPGEHSDAFDDFINKCLMKNPEERPDVKTLLRHEWIVSTKLESVDLADWIRQTMDLQPKNEL